MTETFSADADELFEAGRIVLPRAAQHYAQIAGILGGTGTAGSTGRTDPGGANAGPVYPIWCELRDDLHRCIAGSAHNLLDTGRALVVAAAAYGYVDDENATKLLSSPGGMYLRKPPGDFEIPAAPPR